MKRVSLKRLVSFIVAIAMIISLISVAPANVYAADESVDLTEYNSTKLVGRFRSVVTMDEPDKVDEDKNGRVKIKLLLPEEYNSMRKLYASKYTTISFTIKVTEYTGNGTSQTPGGMVYVATDNSWDCTWFNMSDVYNGEQTISFNFSQYYGSNLLEMGLQFCNLEKDSPLTYEISKVVLSEGQMNFWGNLDSVPDTSMPAPDPADDPVPYDPEDPGNTPGGNGGNDQPGNTPGGNGGNDQPGNTPGGNGGNDQPGNTPGGSGGNDQPGNTPGGNGGSDQPGTTPGGNNDVPSVPATPNTIIFNAPDGTALGVGASEAAAEKAILTSGSEEGPAGSVFGILQLRAKKTTKNSITVTWKKLSGCKYVLYGSTCGSKYKKIKTLKKNTYTQKKLKKGKYYKYLVVAIKNGKVVSASKTLHVATKGGKVGNYKKVTLNKTKVTLKKGKSFKLKTKQIAESKKLKVKNHRGIKYESSNKKVVKVSSKGQIKALKKGTAYVYAYSQSGVFAKIKVTVK